MTLIDTHLIKIYCERHHARATKLVDILYQKGLSREVQLSMIDESITKLITGIDEIRNLEDSDPHWVNYMTKKTYQLIKKETYLKNLHKYSLK